MHTGRPEMFAHSRENHGNGMPWLPALMVQANEYHFSAYTKTFGEATGLLSFAGTAIKDFAMRKHTPGTLWNFALHWSRK